MLELRSFRDDDGEAVWQLHDLALEDAGAHGGAGPWEDDLRDIPATYLDSGGDFLVGFVDGELVTMGGLLRLSAGEAEIRRMRVHPNFQRQGLAVCCSSDWKSERKRWAAKRSVSTRQTSRQRPGGSTSVPATAKPAGDTPTGSSSSTTPRRLDEPEKPSDRPSCSSTEAVASPSSGRDHRPRGRRPRCCSSTGGGATRTHAAVAPKEEQACSCAPPTTRKRLSRGMSPARYRWRVSSQPVPGGVVHPLPTDLHEALMASTTALDAWKDITPLARNEFICWVEDAKQQTTRERRIRRTQEELEDGQRRPCCWPGCKHRDRAAR